MLTKHNTNDNITKSSARRTKHRWICGIWRGTEVVITGRSWKPLGGNATGVRIPYSPPNKNRNFDTKRIGVTVLNFYAKNFDYPEKPLKYKHIRRISDWFYYQFTTFNGLRLDMPEHLASMKQPNTNATHWRRGTSAITQFHIAPHWRRYLIPTGKQGTPLFFYPHVTQ